MENINIIKEKFRNLIELNFWDNNKVYYIIEEYYYSEEFNKDFDIIIKFNKFFNKKEINLIRDMGIYFDGFDMFEEDEEDFWKLFN